MAEDFDAHALLAVLDIPEMAAAPPHLVEQLREMVRWLIAEEPMIRIAAFDDSTDHQRELLRIAEGRIRRWIDRGEAAGIPTLRILVAPDRTYEGVYRLEFHHTYRRMGVSCYLRINRDIYERNIERDLSDQSLGVMRDRLVASLRESDERMGFSGPPRPPLGTGITAAAARDGR
jgi:hypothetical protein